MTDWKGRTMTDVQTVLLVNDAQRSAWRERFTPNWTLQYAEDAAQAALLLEALPAIPYVWIDLPDAQQALHTLGTLRALRGGAKLAIAFCLDPDDTALAEQASLQADELVYRPIRPALFAHAHRNLQRLALNREGGVAPELRTLLDCAQESIGLFTFADNRVRLLYATPGMIARLTGYGAISQPAGIPLDSVVNDADELAILQAEKENPLPGKPIDLVLTQGLQSPAQYKLHLRATRMPGMEGEQPVYLACVSDIPFAAQPDSNLLDSNRKMITLMNTVPGGIAVYDLTTTPQLLYYNDILRRMCGYTIEEYDQIMREDYLRLVDPRDHAMLISMIDRFRQKPQSMEDYFRVLSKDGTVHWMRASVSPVGEGLLCNAVFIDVTREKETEEKNERMLSELYYRAGHDALTGISNRETFYTQTAELLRQNRETPFVILALDIDRFKLVNDLFGKEAGDRVLVAIAHWLRRTLQHIGTYARLESDHFVACFPQRFLDMERIQSLVEAGFKHQKIDFRLQLSFGIYPIHNIDIPINYMCDWAMMALRTVKGNAVRRFAYYDETLRQTMLEENVILSEMNDALEQGQFVPYLQPIFSIDTRELVGSEVLVRWKHPLKGLIPPGRFIPLFEHNGFITKLDLHTWNQACTLLARWRRAGYTRPLSINISRTDLYSPRLCEQLLDLTRRHGIEPDALRLEITESAYAKAPGELIAVLNRLREAGFLLQMDDFGSEYSSLNVLMDMPVDTLKLDMRFLAALRTNPRAASILTSVVRMAKWMRIPVVAEGVETDEQLAFLRSIGCDHVQGYLLGAPMSAEDFEARYIQSSTPVAEALVPTLCDTVELSVLWNNNLQIDALFNGMIGGIGIYELQGDTLEIRRVNDGYYELFGCTPKQVFDDAQNALLTIHPDDWDTLLAACHRAACSGQVEHCVCRHVHRRNNRQVWLEARLRRLGKAGDRDVLFFLYNDVTEQKEFEQARALRNYAMVLRGVYSVVYELNLNSRVSRMIYHTDGRTGFPDGEPLSALTERLNRMFVDAEDQLPDDVFAPGYLEQKLRETQSDYYLLERRIHGEGGQPRWASFTFLRIPNDAMEEVYLLCIADVDNHKRAENLLMENRWLQMKQQEQARYQTLLEHLGTSLFEWDLHTGKTTASRNFEQFSLSGYDMRFLTSYKDVEPYLHPQDLSVFRTFVNDLLAHNNATVTLRLLTHAGQALWCRLLCTLAPDEEGHIRRCVVAISLIDDQMKIRETLLDEQMRFRAFAENFMVGMGIFEVRNGRQRILYLSPGYRKMIGYDEQEALFDDLTSYAGVHPEDVPRFEEGTRTLLRTQQPFQIDYRVFHKNGSILWLRALNTLYPGPDGASTRIFAVMENITEYKTVHPSLRALMNRIPLAVGIYNLDQTAEPLYENTRMTSLLTAMPQPESPADPAGMRAVLFKPFMPLPDADLPDAARTLSLADGTSVCLSFLFTAFEKQPHVRPLCVVVETPCEAHAASDASAVVEPLLS